MKTYGVTGTIRRSFALPGRLVMEATEASPPDLRGNLNRLVKVALQEFVARRKRKDFENAMARMSADPAIRLENRRIAKEFRRADSDGFE